MNIYANTGKAEALNQQGNPSISSYFFGFL